MKRNLITQIKNEWRDNVWIVVGLAFVGLAIWYFGIMLYSSLSSYFVPMGFDEENVYVLSRSQLQAGSPDYVDYGVDREAVFSEDLRSLIKHIRQSPNVEAAAFSANGTPYNMSFQGNVMRIAGPELDTIGYYVNLRRASPDIVDVLNLKSLTGKDNEYLKKKMNDGEIIVGTSSIITNTWDKSPVRKHSDEDLLGNYLNLGGDTTTRYHVADIIDNIRRTRFESLFAGTALFPIDESGDIQAWDVILRVKPGCGRRFIEEFETTPEMNRQRNTYLYDLRSLSDMRRATEHSSILGVRVYVLQISFMVLIIFLGLLGTFWFRMQQRVSEIAIRRVCGASRGDIFRRVIGEGLILLAVATVFISIIGWIIAVRIYDGLLSRAEILYSELFTIVLMALGIVLSISYPAWRAMKIEPAVAVKDE